LAGHSDVRLLAEEDLTTALQGPEAELHQQSKQEAEAKRRERIQALDQGRVNQESFQSKHLLTPLPFDISLTTDSSWGRGLRCSNK
jgi:hypothetical protein